MNCPRIRAAPRDPEVGMLTPVARWILWGPFIRTLTNESRPVLDFNSNIVFKLKEIKAEEGLELVAPMLIADETIFASFKTVRDHVIFTNHRVIAVNVEGITGKKKDFTSLPYSKIQAFSVRTASLLALDTVMDLWFNSMGLVTFEFSGRFDIAAFNKLIGAYILASPGSH